MRGFLRLTGVSRPVDIKWGLLALTAGAVFLSGCSVTSLRCESPQGGFLELVGIDQDISARDVAQLCGGMTNGSAT